VAGVNLNVSIRNGRKYLYIEKGYRGKDGKVKKKNVLTIGYADQYENEFEDPVAHFREVAKKMTGEEKRERSVSLPVNMKEELPQGSVGARNLGYALPLKIYHELEIDKFLKSNSRKEGFAFNANSIMTLLVMSRILSPGSKKKDFVGKGQYFERFDFTLDDTYRALTYFDKISEELQRFMHESVRTKYGSDTSIIYYDVTNYYFEIRKPDDMRKYGKAKQNRKKPIVQLGLAMDNCGIPLHYELFPGNRLDKETFRSVIGQVRKNYGTGRIIVVADMGIITGDNIHYLVGDKPEKPKNGYVFSFSVRGGTAAFQKYVLSEEGYKDRDGKPATGETDFKIKSRVMAREINVTMDSGRRQNTKKVYEKQVVFWNRKYYAKARAERAEVIAKAEALIADPKKFNKATSYGAAGYVSNLEFDKKTKEVLDTGKLLSLDTAKIEEEEQYDGYYSIVTSELNMSDSEIIGTYRGLWEIEETFKITKGDLEARPVYVRDYGHIDAHFLICFIALTILRVMQKTLGRKYSTEKIVECLNKIECMHEQENIYLFGYRSEISDDLGKAFDIDFTKKRLRLTDIKKILGDVKK
jgi:transposase